MSKIILSSDTTCDIGPELQARYGLELFPFRVVLGERDYRDGVDLTAGDIIRAYKEKKILPKTAASSPEEYKEYFRQWTDQGCQVIHFTIGSGISGTFQNVSLAAGELEGVYPIDSQNLSTGIALLIIQAAERIAAGMPAALIQVEVNSLRGNVHSSFVIDTLEYLHKGGRCSALAKFGANLLGLKPCIEVDNLSGKMSVGKKYRGSLDKVLPLYTRDKLARFPGADKSRVFITHSPIAPELVEIVRQILVQEGFQEIFETDAGCTITSHCGPGTLGVLFMADEGHRAN